MTGRDRQEQVRKTRPGRDMQEQVRTGMDSLRTGRDRGKGRDRQGQVRTGRERQGLGKKEETGKDMQGQVCRGGRVSDRQGKVEADRDRGYVWCTVLFITGARKIEISVVGSHYDRTYKLNTRVKDKLRKKSSEKSIETHKNIRTAVFPFAKTSTSTR